MKKLSLLRKFYIFSILFLSIIFPASFFAQSYSYTLDAGFEVKQNTNEVGLVSVKGNLIKPFTSNDVKLSILYKDNNGVWVTGWCKKLYSYNQYNEIVDAKFELPGSSQPLYNVKIILTSEADLANFNLISWEKTISHYKFGDYSLSACDLDENEYTILLTPKKESTLIRDSNGLVTGVKDRVTSLNSWNRLATNVSMENKRNDVVFSPKIATQLLSDSNGAKSLKLINTGALSDTIATTTPEFIYNEGVGHPLPYLYTYDDPVYIFAGKFSIKGFFIKFSQWYGDTNGPGYHNFKNPDALQSRYFNLYNTITQKLSELISDQEPVVFVSSAATGFRVYKKDGSYLTVTGYSNYGNLLFGYGNDQAKGRRGPGSENFRIDNTPEMTIYGLGALRNNAISPDYKSARSLEDIDKEINKFIKYTGVFGSSSAYDDISDCAHKCYTINPSASPDVSVVDWTKAPNSYIFTGKDKNGQPVDGLYIPVKKAHTMWRSDKYIGGAPIPTGTVSADVLWEDNIGLIKSGENYALEIIGSGENAKIKVPIHSVKKGNAVINYKVNGEIYWSWHIWVTDDPSYGSAYKSFDGLRRELADGMVENIPDSEWGWMDRNLGAIGSSISGENWSKNGGLLYQWGRKDPIPPLTDKGELFYEISGSVGKVIHRSAHPQAKGYKIIDDFTKMVSLSNANIVDNLKLSVKNPLSLIYVNQDGASTQASYAYKDGVYYDINWFGTVRGLQPYELSKVNLWSDNSKGIVDAYTAQNYNDPANAQPYRTKSPYDPCPNGWRIPSFMIAHATNKIRMDYSPYGAKSDVAGYLIPNIKPGLSSLPSYLQGIKVYPQVGFDMSNVGGYDMGIFPGTGMIDRRDHNGQYSDGHETYLWTATMTMWDPTNLPWSVSGRALRLTPDQTQIINNYKPDPPGYPNVYGVYSYLPMAGLTTNKALGCRCIKDPLFIKNNYQFDTEFFSENKKFTDGIDNPNSYLLTMGSTETILEIPVSKAFAVQSQILNNPDILNPENFNNLKANVLWSDKNNLITNITVSNASPTSVAQLGNTSIKVKIAPQKNGNAVITLHNGSIASPIYWSWHIWVTNTPVGSTTHITDTPINTDNYVNYTQFGTVMKTIFMDRNLGATDAMPNIANPAAPTAAEMNLINNSQGYHYQWGRKDPIPIFQNISGTFYSVFLGNTDDSGNITYTALTNATYNSTYPVFYSTYKNGILSTDKIDMKISKILKYSVENPLRFMKPDVAYTPTPSTTNPIYTNGADWLFDAEHSALLADRWGSGTKKSIFDPCPKGWRIPDLIQGAFNKNKKASPWSFKSNNDAANTPVAISTEAGYYGTAVNSGAYGTTKGFIFNNVNYNIGNYPKGVIRGQRSVMYPTFTINHSLSPYNGQSLGGYWYASLMTNLYGRGVYFSNDRFGRIQIIGTDIDPYVGMNCRCVKVEDENGAERGPIPNLPVTSNTGAQARNTFSKEIIIEKENKKIFLFYPNPVNDLLYIDGVDDNDQYYQIYNMAGQKIHSGKFEDKKTSLSFLIPGVYFIRINDSEQIIKIIKNP